MKSDVKIVAALLLTLVGIAGATAINPDILGENGIVSAGHYPMAEIAYGPHWALSMNGSAIQQIPGDMVWVMNPNPDPIKTGKSVIGSFGQKPAYQDKWKGWL